MTDKPIKLLFQFLL